MSQNFTFSNQSRFQAAPKPLEPVKLESLLSPLGLVEEMKTLPSGPAVLPSLMTALGEDLSGVDSVVKIIQLERSLMVKVLKLSNSVHHGGRGACSNVEEAVKRLGFKQVQRTVVNAISAELLGKELKAYGLTGSKLWCDSVTVALAAEMLATVTGENPATAYCLGLLHGVGMVVIDSWIVSHRLNLRVASAGFPFDTVESEIAILGFSYAETGAALLQKWNFPASLCEPIRWQYEPEKAGAHSKAASILYIARWARDVINGEISVPLVPTTSECDLGLSKYQLLGVVEQVRERLHASARLLGIA